MSQLAIEIDRQLRARWLLAAVLLGSFFWQIWSFPLYQPGELAFAEATRQMLSAGEGYAVYYADGPRYLVPPLVHWLQAISTNLLGFNELALRLPSALAASLLAFVLWRFVREQLDEQTATVAGLTLALALGMSFLAKAAVADAVLALLIALTCSEAYRYWQSPRRAPLLRGYLWLALGFLAKGPVAFFLPLLVTLLFFWSEGAMRVWLRAVAAPLGWLVLLVVLGPWYLAVYLDDPPSLLQVSFLKHNLEAFGGLLVGQAGSVGFQLLVLPVVLLPFTTWLVQSSTVIRQTWSDPLQRFLWLWAAGTFVTFLMSGTTSPYAVLFAAAPMSVLMARHRELLANRTLAFAPAIALAVVLFFVSEILALVVHQVDEPRLAASLAQALRAFDLLYYVLVLAWFAALGVLWRWTALRTWQGLILAGLIQLVLINGVVMPKLLAATQAPLKEGAGVAPASPWDASWSGFARSDSARTFEQDRLLVASVSRT